LHPFAEILLSGGRLQHQFVDALGKEVIERIDVAHLVGPFGRAPAGYDVSDPDSGNC
jgi:hypothetical protein